MWSQGDILNVVQHECKGRVWPWVIAFFSYFTNLMTRFALDFPQLLVGPRTRARGNAESWSLSDEPEVRIRRDRI
jgi:hypothetical protein